jgi:hypothetical protein
VALASAAKSTLTPVAQANVKTFIPGGATNKVPQKTSEPNFPVPTLSTNPTLKPIPTIATTPAKITASPVTNQPYKMQSKAAPVYTGNTSLDNLGNALYEFRLLLQNSKELGNINRDYSPKKIVESVNSALANASVDDLAKFAGMPDLKAFSSNFNDVSKKYGITADPKYSFSNDQTPYGQKLYLADQINYGKLDTKQANDLYSGWQKEVISSGDALKQQESLKKAGVVSSQAEAVRTQPLAPIINQPIVDPKLKAFNESIAKASEQYTIPQSAISLKALNPNETLNAGTINVQDGIKTTAQLVNRPIGVEYLEAPNGQFYNANTGQFYSSDRPSAEQQGRNATIKDKTNINYVPLQNKVVFDQLLQQTAQNLYDTVQPAWTGKTGTDIRETKQVIDPRLLGSSAPSIDYMTQYGDNKKTYNGLTIEPKVTKAPDPVIWKFVQPVTKNEGAPSTIGNVSIVTPEGFTPTDLAKKNEEILQKEQEEKVVEKNNDLEKRKLEDEENRRRAEEANQREEENKQRAINNLEAKRLADEKAAELARLRSAQQFDYDSQIEAALRAAEGNSSLARRQFKENEDRQRTMDEESRAQRKPRRTNPNNYAEGFAEKAIESKAIRPASAKVPAMAPPPPPAPVAPLANVVDASFLPPKIDGLQFGGN